MTKRVVVRVQMQQDNQIGNDSIKHGCKGALRLRSLALA